MPLNKNHQQTCDALLGHPIAKTLHRRDVLSLLAALGTTTEEHNGNLKTLAGEHTLVLRPSSEHDISDIDELMMIRHFLTNLAPATTAAPAETAAHFLVVLDHREARIFKTELQGTLPTRITPVDPHGYGRTLRDVETDGTGQRKPESKSFYDAIAHTLNGASAILLCGSATGASSAMDQLLTFLRDHHPGLAKKVLATLTLNTPHLSEPQLLATAREFYEHHATPVPVP